GKPVYFQIVAPWDKPVRQEETFSPASSRAAEIILILVYLSVIVAGVFLARRNVRQGRSDTRGAFKITLFVFLLSLAASLLVADHIPDLAREQPLLFKIAGDSLFDAVLLALLYLALEPFVRRRWANLIISWNRLLAGDFGDPLVGRDILIGGILGLGHTVIIYLEPLSKQLLGLMVAPNPSLDVSFLQSFKHLLANFLMSPGNAIFLAFILLLLLVLLVAIFRKQWLAIAALWTVYFLVLGLFFGGGHWVGWLWTGSIATLSVVCVSRFGLLAMISFHTFFHLSFHDAITANVSSWYFGNTIFSAVVLLGLAIYGFYTSLAGQKIFEGKILRDIEN
ncbi:MAG: hypothetical protein ABR566_08575, partial [Pyrinomonadaceae bacterium]